MECSTEPLPTVTTPELGFLTLYNLLCLPAHRSLSFEPRLQEVALVTVTHAQSNKMNCFLQGINKTTNEPKAASDLRSVKQEPILNLKPSVARCKS